MSTNKELELVECYEAVVVKKELTQWNLNWYKYLIHRAIFDMHLYFECYESKSQNKYYLKVIAFKNKYLKPFFQNRIKPFLAKLKEKVKLFLSKIKERIKPYSDKLKFRLKFYFWYSVNKYYNFRLWLKTSLIRWLYKIKDYKLNKHAKLHNTTGWRIIRKRHPIHLALMRIS